MKSALLILIGVCLIQSIASWPTFVNNLVTGGWNWFDSNGNTQTRKRACQLGETSADCDECGVTYSNPNARIVGGYEAVPHSWPAASMIIFQYKANVQVRNTIVRVDREFLCGGFLVDRTTVVTAAHCITEEIEVNVGSQFYTIKVTPNNFFPTQGSMFKVFLGIHSNQGALHGGDVSPGVRAVVSRVIKHPGFDKETNQNDIAILKLANPVKLDQNVQIACLPNPAIRVYPAQSNIPTFAIGWGTLYSNGPTASTLQNVRLNIYEGKFCADVAPLVKKDWNAQICAGEYNGGKDTCQGDSGGAIFVQDNVNNKAKYIAVGIVSYGEGCAERGKPGIYTRVSAYTDWIRSHMQH